MWVVVMKLTCISILVSKPLCFKDEKCVSVNYKRKVLTESE
jgi:hypothetical protein